MPYFGTFTSVKCPRLAHGAQNPVSDEVYTDVTRRFSAIYDSLPHDAQQALVREHLLPLLNSLPQEKTRKTLSAAARLQKRHASIPKLDLRSKKLEINNMLRELSKDAKRAYVMDSSNRTDLLNEIVGSLASWMNDIWTVVYEHNVDFSLAHQSLLFVSATLERLESIRMVCVSVALVSWWMLTPHDCVGASAH